ncbi:MAG: P-type conjugative transfer protein TrbG [Sphingomicrobium sp.]
MNRFPLLLLAPALGLGACAGNAAKAAPAGLAAAHRLSDIPRPAVPDPAGLAGPDRTGATDAGGDGKRAASGEPGSAQVHSWREGSLYRLETAPERVSDIMLEPGEALVSVAAGDTARWIIGETMSGSGPGRRTHVLVKPSEAGLATNLIIATDRRVYHVEALSSGTASMASLSWIYPDDALLAIRPSGASAPLGAGPMNFDYSIEGDRPSWRPLRAFDDGERVFIEFPPGLAQGEAPPLFVRPAGRGTALVNYRVRGRYYIVDRLFSAAELRLGEKPQQVVRIIRANADHGRRRGS